MIASMHVVRVCACVCLVALIQYYQFVLTNPQRAEAKLPGGRMVAGMRRKALTTRHMVKGEMQTLRVLGKVCEKIELDKVI